MSSTWSYFSQDRVNPTSHRLSGKRACFTPEVHGLCVEREPSREHTFLIRPPWHTLASAEVTKRQRWGSSLSTLEDTAKEAAQPPLPLGRTKVDTEDNFGPYRA